MTTQATAWHPALWLRSLAQTAAVPWPVGRSVRATLAIAGPVLVGSVLGAPSIGMSISMGALMMAAGERPIGYGARLQQILVSAPIAASAYFLGALSDAPPPVTVAVVAVLAFLSGVLSGYSNVLSSATMQAMLIAALAIGVKQTGPDARSAVLFLTGVALYLVLLALEAVLDRRRPERDALAELLRALADLAHRRAEGSDDVPTARARALAALEAFDAIALVHRGTAEGPTPQYERAATISRAADQVVARLLAEDARPSVCAEAATRLEACADAVAHRRRLATHAADTIIRVAMLETAIWGKLPKHPHLPLAERARISMPGPALLATAGRLSLCTALAYIAFFTIPIDRAYWIPMTVAIVMKPDLGSVFGRASLRSVGTVGGALIAVTLEPVTEAPLAAGIVIAGLAACLPWAGARSYGWRALLLTPLLMVLLGIVVPDASIHDLSIARIATTLLGATIAVVAGYLIWPSARHALVAEPFGSALDELAHYARDVHARVDPETIASDRRTVYRHLSNIKTSLQRTLADPPPAGREAWAWIPVVSAAERVADRITSASVHPARPAADAEIAGLVEDISTLARHEGKVDIDARSPSPPAHGGDHADPNVREIADELAHLAPMLARK